MTYLLIITLVPSPIPSQIPHTQFNIISLGVDEVNIMPRIYVWQFTLVHIAKCHSTISWIMSWYFPMNWLQGNSMCINSRQSIPHGVLHLEAIRHDFRVELVECYLLSQTGKINAQLRTCKQYNWLIDCFTAHQHRKAISAKKRC